MEPCQSQRYRSRKNERALHRRQGIIDNAGELEECVREEIEWCRPGNRHVMLRAARSRVGHASKQASIEEVSATCVTSE
jgi:hypothetical protein